jgi:putative transposase
MEDGRMRRKRHKLKEIIAKLQQDEVLTGQGHAIVEAVRSTGVTEVTYYRWRLERRSDKALKEIVKMVEF